MKRLLFAVTVVSALLSAHPGVGIVQDSRGNIYYTDLSRVWKIAPDGKKTVVVPDVHTHELYIDKEDRLFGEHLWYNGERADTWGHFVWRYSPDGRFDKIIPNSVGFLRGYGFVRDSSGTMYWEENGRIFKRSSSGSVSPMSKHRLVRPGRLAASPSGHLYCNDNGVLKRIDPDGTIHSVAVILQPYQPHDIHGVWIGPDRSVYLAAGSAKAVKRVTQKGDVSIVHTSSGYWSPSGGLIDRHGDLWVLEYSTENAVRVLYRRKNSPAKVF